jgi:hypothetical protein
MFMDQGNFMLQNIRVQICGSTNTEWKRQTVLLCL